MQPLVSVVVPVFNGLPHLHACIASILAQDYENLDIVLMEGGSTDGSLAVMKAVDDPRVRVEQMPAGTSAAGNWTAATQAGRGELIKLVCQDDVINPDAISTQVADLLAHPGASMAIAQRDVIDATGKVLYAPRGGAGLRNGMMAGDAILRACYLHGTNVVGEPLTVLFRREAVLDAMPWDDSNPLVLDLNTYAKVLRSAQAFVRKASVGGFRVSTSSWSTRLAKVQLEQYRQWQREYEAATPTTATDRARAALNARLQAAMRRAAYSVLRVKRSFVS